MLPILGSSCSFEPDCSGHEQSVLAVLSFLNCLLLCNFCKHVPVTHCVMHFSDARTLLILTSAFQCFWGPFKFPWQCQHILCHISPSVSLLLLKLSIMSFHWSKQHLLNGFRCWEWQENGKSLEMNVSSRKSFSFEWNQTWKHLTIHFLLVDWREVGQKSVIISRPLLDCEWLQKHVSDSANTSQS